MVLLIINIGNFIISCNVRDIFVPKGKNQGTILKEKIRLPKNVTLLIKLRVIIFRIMYPKR